MKAERERKGLSAQKVADELHLDAWVVDALESDDYARVGPSVYAKGHLKRYAEILGLPPAEIVEAYASQPAEPAPPPPAPSMRMATSAPTGSEIPWLQMAGFAVVAAGLAGVLWWKPWHPRGSTPTAAAAPAQSTASLPGENAAADAPASDGAGGADAAAPAVPASDGTRGSAPASSDSAGRGGVTAAVPGAPRAAAPTGAGAGAGHALTPASATAAESAQNPAEATAGAGRARLRLSFSADSWVDVRDAAGQRVFVGNGRANSVRTIAGAAPLRVYLRSASGVQLEINNHAVAIGPQYVIGSAAHFEAGADGVLRRDTHAAAPRPHG